MDLVHAGSSPDTGTDRRDFVATASSLAMFAGLAAGYGTFGAVAARYLFPAKPREQAWLYVTRLDALKPGDSLVYRAPAGEKIAIARQGAGETVDDFIALSSTCPHLGCQVHWEGVKDRFFCPCHNGTFDPTGRGTGGPPGEAGLSLPRYPLRIESGLLYIQVPTERLSGAAEKTAGTIEKRSDSQGEESGDEVAIERIDRARKNPFDSPGARARDPLTHGCPPGPGHDPCLFPDPPHQVV
jgi:Rieske Fe-S protein